MKSGRPNETDPLKERISFEVPKWTCCFCDSDGYGMNGRTTSILDSATFHLQTNGYPTIKD